MSTQTISREIAINPSKIMQTGLAFWSSKVLLTAVKLDLFSLLSGSGKTANEIKIALNLQSRGLYDFLDTLVSLGFLHREGIAENAIYENTLETEAFLDKKKPSYIGGILTMANNRLYPFWNSLEEALKTGLPQNESKYGKRSLFEEVYSDNDKLEEFVAAMSGIQFENFKTFSKQFDFSGYRTHADIGGASGSLSCQVAVHNPGIQSISFDLPVVCSITQSNINSMGLNDRVEVVSGDFFKDEFPKADVITMGNILHDWDLPQKKMLIRKAFDALPDGGAFVAIENVIDDNRKENAFGLMMSLNMLIETDGGFDYTASEFMSWTREAGFKRMEIMHLAGPTSAAIAYK